jgi:hypothetical protein
MEKVVPLVKIKWTVVLRASDVIGTFATCLEKLTQSVDPKRTEIILLQAKENKLVLDTFSYFCEKANILYNYGDDDAHAVSLAKGMYVIFMTDHTLVSKNFLVKLTFAADQYEQQMGKVAVVAPISNDMVPNLGLTPANLEGVQAKISQQSKNNIPYHYTLALTPYCLMFRKEFLAQEERSPVTPGSPAPFNFKELILKANYRGYHTVAANDTLVYHFPETVLHQYETYHDENNKLAVLYRIKIDHEDIRDVFAKSLQRTSEFCSNIYVLDDNSKVKIGMYFKEKFPELWSKVTKYEKFSRPYDERRDINELLDWADKDGCTWVFVMEADEIVENKVTTEFINRLLSPPNPEVMAYKVNHYHFWNDEDTWRVDSPWGKMNDVRIARLVPGRRIVSPGVIAGQCGYTIKFPDECIRETSIRVKNYGYLRPSAREEKKEFFEKLNISLNGKKVTDWSYLTQSNGGHLHPWVEDNTISFYTPTNKGGSIIESWLEHVAYFADEVVVGNDSASLPEDDLTICQNYGNVKVVPVVMGDNYGEARNVLLRECTSKYIMQLDTDERLDDCVAVRRMVDIAGYDVWMFTIPNLQPDGGKIITETMRLFKNKDGVKYWGRLHETIDAFVKQENWKISKSPIQLTHFGYTLQGPDESYRKMQKYLKINLQQMKENPMHGMSYYNVALHLLEDDLVDDAVKLLDICAFLQPGFALAGLELGKSYIRKASQWVDRSLKIVGPDHTVAQGFKGIQDTLHKIKPNNYTVAKGHCLQYFNINAKERDWLRDHVLKMEKQIETMKTKKMEEQVKK